MIHARPRHRVVAVTEALLLGLVLLCLDGCKGCNTPASPKIVAPKDDVPGPSDALYINVYVDGSGSMKHFLQQPSPKEGPTPVQTNYFKKLLDKCETSLRNAPGTGGWKDVRLNFWKFGSGKEPSKLDAGGLQRMSTDLSAFSEGNTLIETPVESPGQDVAIGVTPLPEVKIIITDLYQSNGQLEKPADALADKYLRNDKDAVGILAVRNPFTGPVEDLPGTPRNKTLPNAADSMPFYVIVAGPAADVRHVLESLLDRAELKDALQQKLAAEFLFTRAPRASQMQGVKFEGEDFSKVSLDYQGQHAPLVQVGSGKLTMNWQDAKENESPGVKLAAGETLEFAALQAGLNGSLAADPDAQAAVAMCGGGGTLLCATFDRAKLAKGKTYVFRINRVLTGPADTLEPASSELKNWNIEISDAERISANPEPRFPAVPGLQDARPGMTPDLSKFLKALQGQMFHDKVHVTSYYLYLQAS